MLRFIIRNSKPGKEGTLPETKISNTAYYIWFCQFTYTQHRHPLGNSSWQTMLSKELSWIKAMKHFKHRNEFKKLAFLILEEGGRCFLYIPSTCLHNHSSHLNRFSLLSVLIPSIGSICERYYGHPCGTQLNWQSQKYIKAMFEASVCSGLCTFFRLVRLGMSHAK